MPDDGTGIRRGRSHPGRRAGGGGIRALPGRRRGRTRDGRLDPGLPGRVRRGDRLRPSRRRRSLFFIGGGDRRSRRPARGPRPPRPRRDAAARGDDASRARPRRGGTRGRHPGGRDGPVHLPGGRLRTRAPHHFRAARLDPRPGGPVTVLASSSPTAAGGPTRGPPPGASSTNGSGRRGRRTASSGSSCPTRTVIRRSSPITRPRNYGRPRTGCRRRSTDGSATSLRKRGAPPPPPDTLKTATPPHSAKRWMPPTKACGATTR